jgi:hypothetical protein
LILKSFLKSILWLSKWSAELKEVRKECARNIELQWLLCAIIPNYHSISDFRKQNPSGLKICSNFVSFLKDADLIGVKSSLLMEQKQSATVRKRISIKRKLRDI